MTACIFCGGSVWAGVVRLHGETFPMCGTCGDLAAESSYGDFEALPCLQQMAMELEQIIPLRWPADRREAVELTRDERRVRRQLGVGFGEGRFRQACPCPTCEGLRSDPLQFQVRNEWKPEVKLKERPVLEVARVPTAVLRTFHPDQRVIGWDFEPKTVAVELAARIAGGMNVSVRPPIKPGSLADLVSVRSQGHWHEIGGEWHYLPIDLAMRAVQDELARLYFADDARICAEGLSVNFAVLRDVVRRRRVMGRFPALAPHGFMHDGLWCDQDGELHRLPEVQ